MARDTPHNVDGLALVVLLQDKHTWPLVIGRVLFNHSGLPGSSKDIPHKNIICGKLIIPVIRDEYVLTCYQVEKHRRHRVLALTSVDFATAAGIKGPPRQIGATRGRSAWLGGTCVVYYSINERL